MRSNATQGALRALAVAGTHVVTLGWDMDEQEIRRLGVLGFGIERSRQRDGKLKWLPGMKTFPSHSPSPAPGELTSSRHSPLQTFQWADYAAEPGTTYSYRLVPLAGAPGDLQELPSVTIEVTTEAEASEVHSIYFNRGAAASQEYARRFENRPPDEIGDDAWNWLSRGLVEGLTSFIDRAQDGDTLHGAFFEFKHPRIFAALEAACNRGVEVAILYDGKTQGEANTDAIDEHSVRDWLSADRLRARSRSGQFAHNKYLVRSANAIPVEVWTGSTNLSVNGLFGHSNSGHAVKNSDVARAFEENWGLLWGDPTKKPVATANGEAFSIPDDLSTGTILPVFSPRPTLDALDWYVRLAEEAAAPVFTTFAFGMDERFTRLYSQRDDVLRFALMERKGNGTKLKEQARTVDRIRRLPNTVVAVGNAIDQRNGLDRWLVERVGIRRRTHVNFIHTKYMLIDPLGADPIVITGSANFSKASSVTNDENMLVIRGDQRVADIYLTEFMRLYTHYAFRESLGFKRPSQPTVPPRHTLVPDAGWIDGASKGQGYFRPGSQRALRRVYFSGGS